MADLRRDLKKKYKQLLSKKLDNNGELQHQCLRFFEDTNKNGCFKLLPFYDSLKVFNDKCKSYPNYKVLYQVQNLYSLLEEAFIHLEHYSLNLHARPWSRHVHTIKVCLASYCYSTLGNVMLLSVVVNNKCCFDVSIKICW